VSKGGGKENLTIGNSDVEAKAVPMCGIPSILQRRPKGGKGEEKTGDVRRKLKRKEQQCALRRGRGKEKREAQEGIKGKGILSPRDTQGIEEGTKRGNWTRGLVHRGKMSIRDIEGGEIREKGRNIGQKELGEGGKKKPMVYLLEKLQFLQWGTFFGGRKDRSTKKKIAGSWLVVQKTFLPPRGKM